MFKKMLAVIVPLAAAAATAVVLAPASAPADTFYKCPPGVHDHHYCKKVKKCKVPNLRGKTVSQAARALHRHGCKLGGVKHRAVSGTGVAVGQIYRSSPGAGFIGPRGTAVTVYVRKAGSTPSGDPDHDGDHDGPDTV